MQFLKSMTLTAVCAALGLVSVTAEATTIKKGGSDVQASPGMMLVPSGKGYAIEKVGNAAAVPPGGNGINYHGGALITGGTNVYYIWYGDAWAGDTATTILTDMMNGTGGSPRFNINTTYFSGKLNAKGTKVKNPVYVSNVVTLKGQITINSGSGTRWHGNSLSDAQIKQVVSEAIAAGDLPSDTQALYFVLTDKNTTATSGFCTAYCGWHANSLIGGQDIKYSFVGNAATKCPSGCISSKVGTTGPNANRGADGMASVIMHELEEATTDPDVGGVPGLKYGWYDNASGMENSDKCAWTFGSTYAVGNGQANMKLGARDFLIQQNWVNASGGKCALAYP